MDEIFAFLKSSGWPASAVVAIGLMLWFIKEKWPKPEDRAQRSERELLSADQDTFRHAMMDMVKALQERCGALEAANAICEKNCARLTDIIVRHIGAAAAEMLAEAQAQSAE